MTIVAPTNARCRLSKDRLGVCFYQVFCKLKRFDKNKPGKLADDEYEQIMRHP
jgi:hypothetical protein